MGIWGIPEIELGITCLLEYGLKDNIMPDSGLELSIG